MRGVSCHECRRASCVAQLKPGDQGFVRPVEASKGRKRQRNGSSSSPATFKVMHAEALVGMLLAMGSGASSAPKGGLTGMMNAALRGELQPEVSGKFGERAYKDEPWSRSMGSKLNVDVMTAAPKAALEKSAFMLQR